MFAVDRKPVKHNRDVILASAKMNSIPAVMKLKVMGSLSFRNSLKTVFNCLGLSLCAYCLGPIPAPWKRRNVVLGPAVKPGCQRF